MKTEIYFFSGTGNSLHIAKVLNERIKDSKLIPIGNIMQCPIIKSNAARVIFVFPVYYRGLPKIVENLIRKIDLSSAENIMYVSTIGNPLKGNCSTSKIHKLLARKGKTLTGGYAIPMPGNYIKMIEYKEEEQFTKLKESKSKIEFIINKILSSMTEVEPDTRSLTSKIINNVWQKYVHKSDKSFFLTEACNSCGICERVCPVYNIEIIHKKPLWCHKCQECLACIHFCPQLAIQTKKTINRSRYHHPDITVTDMIKIKKG
jgi:ferredoxin/flavodoxin